MSKIRWGEKVYALMQLQSTSQNFSTYAGVEKAFLLAPCDIEKFKKFAHKKLHPKLSSEVAAQGKMKESHLLT